MKDNTYIERHLEDIDPYFLLPREIFQNPNISLECKAILAFIEMNRENPKISLNDIFNFSPELSKDRVLELIEEAKIFGYIREAKNDN